MQCFIRRGYLRLVVASWLVISALLAAGHIEARQEPTRIALTDNDCGNDWMLVVVSDELEIAGRCEGSTPRVLHLAVTSKVKIPERGRLKTFSLGFCGVVTETLSPPGWRATMPTDLPASNQPADVQWRRDRDAPASAERIEDFAVMLRPGWERAAAWGAEWDEFSIGQVLTHDCGLQRR